MCPAKNKGIDQCGKAQLFEIARENIDYAEGGLNGTPNEVASVQGVNQPVEAQMKFYGAWGSDRTYPHMSVGWSWAFDTPFSWTKMVASHFAGTKQGMAISWPKVIMAMDHNPAQE